MAATTGVGFMSANYTSKESQEKCKVKIWDTAGQDSCRKLVPSYFRQADGIIFTFDLTQESSFNNLPDWILAAQKSEKHTNHGGGNIPKIIVGNKVDKIGEEERAIPEEEIKEFAL